MFNRQNSQWTTVDFSPAQELFTQLELLRVRSRDLYRNSPVISHFVSLCQDNIVGSKGFSFKSTVPNSKGSINTKVSKQIEEAWSDFCNRKNFEVTGQYSLNDALDLMVQSLCIDGEILLRKRYQGKYNFQCQLLHAEQLIVTQHENYNMGILKNEDGKPLSYCITQHDPRDGFIKYIYEPAEHIIHSFKPYMIGAPRGVPMIASVMNKVRMMEEYQKAELISARIEASAFIKYKQTQPDDLELSQEQALQTIIPSGPKKTTIEPGMGMVLPPGVDADYIKAEHPSTAFASFLRAMNMEIATGIGISSNSLFLDFEHTSFSSMRAAFIIERAFYLEKQQLFIEQVLGPIFESWLDCACASGALDLPPVMESYDFYKQYQFTGVPFAFADPVKEALAQETLINNRTMSRTKICADNGYTYSDILDDIKHEQELENEKGITLAVLPKNTQLTPAPKDVVGEALTSPAPANVSPDSIKE